MLLLLLLLGLQLGCLVHVFRTLLVSLRSRRCCGCLVKVANLYPVSVCSLFPKSDFGVSGRDGKNTSGHGPGNAPSRSAGFLTHNTGCPGSSVFALGPDYDLAIFRAACNRVTWETNARGPCDIANPVSMDVLLKNLFLTALHVLVEHPNSHEVVAASGDEATFLGGASTIRGPRHGVEASADSVELVGAPVIIGVVLEDNKGTIGCHTSKAQVKLVRRPRQRVHRRLHLLVHENLLPLPSRLLAVDDHLAVIRARG
mmetsp:Transcript_5732/g.11742  ORF Transcript_5732/g.11742 Transcript_5732/m.11742 type:complete len:257 (+) Transcript_5732:1130-1900(+)